MSQFLHLQISTHGLNPAGRFLFKGRAKSEPKDNDARIKNVEKLIDRLNEMSEQEKFNKQSNEDRIKLIEGKLNALNGGPNVEPPELDTRISNIEGLLDKMNALNEMDGNIVNVESIDGGMNTSVPPDENAEERLGEPLARANVDEILDEFNLNDRAEGNSSGKLSVQNFQHIYKYKCFRHNITREPNAASYMLTAFYLKYQLEFAYGLAAIYAALFLCALLTICMECLLFSGKTLEERMCCGMTVNKYTKRDSWESKRDGYDSKRDDWEPRRGEDGYLEDQCSSGSMDDCSEDSTMENMEDSCLGSFGSSISSCDM